MNPAALAILEELLASSQATNANLLRILAGGGGAGGGATAGAALGNLAKTAAPAALALGAVGKAGEMVKELFSAFGSAIGKVIDGIKGTVSALYSFSLQAAMGEAKLSDFYASFKQLPFYIGELFGILSDLTKYNEVLLDHYQKITQSGAAFAGNLSTLAQQAARSYLTLDQFSKVVSENSQVFATMGGNVQNGINRFVQVQNQMMGPNSPYARQILGMGYTFEEAGMLIGSYMRSQGTMNKESLQNNATVIQGTVEYAKQLDILAKITGKRREQIEKEVREIEEEESWQQYLSSLPADAAAAAKTALTQAQQIGGKDFATSMRLAIQTGITTPLTDESKNMSVTSRGVRESYLATVSEAVRNGRRSNEVSALGFNSAQRLVDANKQTFQTMGSLTGVFAVTGNNFTKGMNTVLAYGRTVGNQSAALAKATAQQAEQAKGSAEALARAELAARQFGLELLGLISTAFKPLMPILRDLATAFSTGLKALIGNEGFVNGIKWVVEQFKKIVSSKNSDELWRNIKETLNTVWNNLWPYLSAGIDTFMDKLGFVVRDFFTGGPVKRLNDINDKQEEWLKAQGMTRQQAEQNRQLATPYWQLEEGKKVFIKEIEQREKSITDRFNSYLDIYKERARVNQAISMADQAQGQPARRDFGTSGVLGLLAEPKDAVVHVEEGERVLSPQENAEYNNLATQIAMLNNTNAQILQVMKQTADNTRRTYDATKSLNGNVLHQLA